MKKIYCIAALLLWIHAATAQLSIDQTGQAYTINFDQTFPGVNNGAFAAPLTYSTDAPAAGQLDRNGIQISSSSGTGFNWPSPTVDGMDGQGTSNGGVPNGQTGVYAFSDNGGANRFIGFQANGSDYSPGAMILYMQNNSGFPITQLNISYIGKVFNDAPGNLQVQLYYSTTGNSWTLLTGLGFSTFGAQSGSWESFPVNGSLKNIIFANGQDIYLKWVFSHSGGSFDELGFDDISIEPLAPKLSFDTPFTIQKEGNNGDFTVVDIGLTFEGPPVFNTTILVGSSDGTATIADNDYDFINPSPLSFLPGSSYPQNFNLQVIIYGDNQIEINEEFYLNLSVIMGVVFITTPQHVVVIANDDGPGVPIYSQRSDGWHTANMWNTQRNGSGTYVPDPNNILGSTGPAFDVVVQPGHEVVMNSNKGIHTLRVETNGPDGDGRLKAGTAMLRYLRLYGFNQWIEGAVGDGANNDGISLEVFNTACQIGGGGDIDLAQIRKAGANPTNLNFNSNCTLRHDGTALYNNQNGQNFNVNVRTGVTLTVTRGHVSIDGENGINGNLHSGSINVQNGGLLDIQQGNLIMTSDNPANGPIAIFVNSGGRIRVGGQIIGNAGVAGSVIVNFFLLNNAVLELSGPGEVIAQEDIRDFFTLSPGSEVIYNSGADQLIEDFDNLVAYAKLTIDGGSNKTLEGPSTVLQELKLTNGLVVLNNHNLFLGPAATSTGAGPNSYVQTNLAGGLVQEVTLLNKYFPVGNKAFNPVTLKNTLVADIFTVRVEDAVLTLGDIGVPFTQKVVARTWQISEAVPGAVNLEITVQWNGNEELSFDRTSCYLSHFTGGAWDIAPSGPASGGNPYTISRSGITSLSPFAVFGDLLLPVELVSFTARRDGAKAVLEWKTASEQNNERFIVERSADARIFDPIGEVAGAGTTNQFQEYRFIDERPLARINYYRLRQVDFDGEFEYSPVRAVDFQGQDAEISVFPNPVIHMLTIRFGQPTVKEGRVHIFNSGGRLLQTVEIPAQAGEHHLDVSSLAPGMYLLQWELGGVTGSRRFIKG
jgi:hypothetical protein